jgi:hypothetical protein
MYLVDWQGSMIMGNSIDGKNTTEPGLQIARDL